MVDNGAGEAYPLDGTGVEEDDMVSQGLHGEDEGRRLKLALAPVGSWCGDKLG